MLPVKSNLSTAALILIFKRNSVHRLFQVVPCLLTAVSILINNKNSIEWRFIVTVKLKRYYSR